MNVQRELQAASKCAQTQKEHIPVLVEKDMNLLTPSSVKVKNNIIAIYKLKYVNVHVHIFYISA